MSGVHNFQRVRWHSRRGMLELDLILVSFADNYFSLLSPAEQDDYVKLLEQEDQDLLAWLLDHAQPEDPAIARIVNVIRSRHGSATAPAP